jgi:8-oxo-dGTP pyrophosphatase MutT (NUDIX family)
VVPVRDGPAGLEVLLLRRHPDTPMSPGAYAFPGGRVEPADTWADALALCRGFDGKESAVLGDGRPVGQAASQAMGYWIAALREAFEETGFLLVWGIGWRPVASPAVGAARLADLRARSREDAGAFRTMLVEAGWRLATDRMAYYARWITPEERPLRYDARFFLAVAFPDSAQSELEPDGRETVACQWVRPAEALAEARAGGVPLPVPTREVLRSLVDAPDAATLLAAARGREVRPVRPRIVREDGRERILLPGDPGYF